MTGSAPTLRSAASESHAWHSGPAKPSACPYEAWLYLPRDLRQRLRGLRAHMWNRERLNHLYDTPRGCAQCRARTMEAA